METFAGMRGGRPSDVVDAIRFVDAAGQWALKGGFADVAVVLETLAERAVSERIRTVLAGGSAKLWLRAGDVARAEPWLRTAPFDMVAELDMVAAIPAGEDTASSRRTVANRLASLMRDLRLDAEWLAKLMTLGIEQMTVDEAIAHLKMIESAWKQETAVVSV